MRGRRAAGKRVERRGGCPVRRAWKLTAYGRAVHDLKLGDRLALVVLVWRRARRLAADD